MCFDVDFYRYKKKKKKKKRYLRKLEDFVKDLELYLFRVVSLEIVV